MKLFNGDKTKKVKKLLENGERRKESLKLRVEMLKEEVAHLYQEKQDDFTKAIVEGGEPKKKLASDLCKAQEELQEAQEQLKMVDGAIRNELENMKVGIDKERKDFIKEKGEDFRKQFDKMNKLKLTYLESIIEYCNMNSEYSSEYWKVFRDIENQVGLRNHDPRDDFHISLNQRYQTERNYNPMVYNEELREALEGKISYLTEKNRNKYKVL